MNPFDSFDSFDMNSLNDFVDEERVDESDSTFSFDQLPVYRSIDVLQMGSSDFLGVPSQLGEVYEPIQQQQQQQQVFMDKPQLSRNPSSRGFSSQQCWQSSLPGDDLFTQLDTEMNRRLAVPCEEEEIGGVSVTSFHVQMSLESLSASLLSFLNAKDIHFEHFGHCGLWKCDFTDLMDACKFRIQVYTSGGGEESFLIEFLRTSGCAKLFGAQFRACRDELCPSMPRQQQTMVAAVVSNMPSTLAVEDLTVAQASLDSFLSWLSSDQLEASRAVIRLLAASPIQSSQQSSEKLNQEDIMRMTLLGAACMQCRESLPSHREDSLAMLSLLSQLQKSLAKHASSSSMIRKVLTTMVDSLIPAAARITASPMAAKCVRASAVRLMDAHCS